ncbi:MAG: META domain-containing protein [Balneolales bacterium]|nr:META domain-containing protein [Balneolales bacterium]
MKFRIFYFLIAAAVLFAACGQEGGDQYAANGSLSEEAYSPADKTWDLVRIGSEQIRLAETRNAEPGITFDSEESRIYGNAGCNQFTGSFAFGELGELRLGNIASTKMMCENENMDVEVAYMDALNRSKAYVVRDNQLFLLDEEGVETVVFVLAEKQIIPES